MESKELYLEYAMNYEQLVNYLQIKYGKSPCDYFVTPEMNSKSKKISRTSEGLFCHHIDEDKGGNLSDRYSAKRQPYEWQKADRLVYCNYLEHLLLHLKIAILRHKKILTKPIDVYCFFTTGGFFQLTKEINTLFYHKGSSVSWRQRCYEEISNNFGDYIDMLNVVLYYLDKKYTGDRCKSILQLGGIIHFKEGNGEIIEIDDNYDFALVRIVIDNRKKVGKLPIIDMDAQMGYKDYICIVKKEMSITYDEKRIWEDVFNTINSNPTEISKKLYDNLQVDFSLIPISKED